MTSSKKEFSPAEQSGMTVGKSAVPQQEGLPPAPAPPPGVPAGLLAGFRRIDQVRQWQGRMLDGFGLGPVETPCRIALETPGVRLMAYGPTQSGAGRGALLIVPAPIKRPYIWDMAPDVSVVRRCRDAGFRVYVAAWTDPTDAEDGFGLADYAGRLISACLDRIVEETGARTVALAGHSLGGTLAAIYAAREPRRVRGLVLVEAPLHFGTASGDFAPMVAAAP